MFLLKKHNITLASKVSNKLEKKLTFTNKNIPSDIFDGTGVYRLNCSDCTQFYIGQTGDVYKRQVKRRVRCILNRMVKYLNIFCKKNVFVYVNTL